MTVSSPSPHPHTGLGHVERSFVAADVHTTPKQRTLVGWATTGYHLVRHSWHQTLEDLLRFACGLAFAVSCADLSFNDVSDIGPNHVNHN